MALLLVAVLMLKYVCMDVCTYGDYTMLACVSQKFSLKIVPIIKKSKSSAPDTYGITTLILPRAVFKVIMALPYFIDLDSFHPKDHKIFPF